ncbi:MAG: 16S rRNA (guanine(527)-N(7))-methyltransferase RsmG [Candidatus Pelagibacterales bacterium]
MSDEVEDFSINNPNVSRETIVKLSIFRDFLLKENQKTNLIAKSQKDKIWMRHIHDSLRILALLEGKEPKNILDIGSGGGFPGIPLAIATQNLDIQYTLIESIKKKSAFLESARKLLDLSNVKVINKRVENLKNVEFDIITCRALAKLTQIFNYSHHLSKQNTVFLLHKGINIVDEINEATKCWFFDYELIENKLESKSYILKIFGLKKIN